MNEKEIEDAADDKKKTGLVLEKDFAWNLFDDVQRAQAKKLAVGLKEFLSVARTERERVDHLARLAREKGFRELRLDDYSEGQGEAGSPGGSSRDSGLKPGDRVYYVNRSRNIAFVVIGKDFPPASGVQLVGAHVDSPRLDIKIRPLYEDDSAGVALFKTHYYGGLKKYQFATIPLALTGVVVKPGGEIIKVDVGTDPGDPVFSIPDLLIHLYKKAQGSRKPEELVKGEEMNVVVGALQSADTKAKKRFKLAILELLHEKYGIEEADFQSADLSLVPAIPARHVGFDSSMIGAPGQDDGICSYAATRAILELDGIPPRTAITALFDKEEIGSNGNTGAQSSWLEQVIADVMARTGAEPTVRSLHAALRNTRMLSSDVTAALDPNFPSVHDKHTAAVFGKGIAFMKYTGSGGKYNSSEASAEYVAWVRGLLEGARIPHQFGTLGAVDEGGGGTIAKYFAESFNCDVIDAGPPLLNMHSPFELSHVADLYSSYLAYKAFLSAGG